jgi:GntR family transcriptional repressor for pyruvate dehydrogenase complex
MTEIEQIDPKKFSLAQAPRRKLAESVAEQLMDVLKTLAPGTKLPPEKDLMQQLGVGRSTVREALKGLEVMGVIEIRHGQGAFVTEAQASSRDESFSQALAKGVTHELLEARHIIEVAIARLAAQRRTEADLLEVETDLREHVRALQGAEPPARPAMRFHTLLAQAAHNDVLASMFDSFAKLMVDRGPRLYERIPNFAAWEVAQHRAIFEAIKASDVEQAASLMAQHVEAMAEHYRQAGAA